MFVWTVAITGGGSSGCAMLTPFSVAVSLGFTKCPVFSIHLATSQLRFAVEKYFKSALATILPFVLAHSHSPAPGPQCCSIVPPSLES